MKIVYKKDIVDKIRYEIYFPIEFYREIYYIEITSQEYNEISSLLPYKQLHINKNLSIFGLDLKIKDD